MKSILIVEPNTSLVAPYSFIDAPSVSRFETIELALHYLSSHTPDIVYLSTSFSTSKSILLFDAIKNLSITSLIPLILVVDLSQTLSHIPGITWAGHIGILSSLSNLEEYNSTIRRVLS